MVGENIKTTSVVIPYIERPQFTDYHNRSERWACIVAHRRAGKTVACVNDLVMGALTCKLPNPRYAYLAPFYTQAKDVAWGYLKEYALAFPGAVSNESELRVDFPTGGRVRLYGSENYDRMRGIPLDGVVLDEPADMDPRVFPEVIRPALSDRAGWATWIGTPKGHNHFHAISEKAKAEPDWFFLEMKASQTGILPQAELDDARKTMTPDQYEQEYECFKPDAMVMCHDRARPISDVCVGDTVLTHTGRFRRVDAIMDRPYAGEMVRIQAYGSRDIVCTPNHPVYVCAPSAQTYWWKEARDIGPGDWLVTPRMHVEGPGIIGASLAEVIAWFTCEGCVSGNNLTFSIGAHEPEYVKDLCAALYVIGQDPTVQEANGVATVSVNSVILSDFLVGACGSQAKNKRLPLGLLRGHEYVVWETLMKGDGCIHQPKGRGNARPVYSFTTVSEGLAQQVQVLGASLGFTGAYTERAPTFAQLDGRVLNGGTSYCVQMRSASSVDRPSGKTCSAKNGALGCVQEVSREPYDGPVYNLQVAGDESYVVNGRAVHNCSFEAAVLGAFYAEELKRARTENRVTNVSWDRYVDVHTAWDLGVSDSTAIIFFQLVGREIHIIETYEASGVGLDHYAEVLRSKPYKYGKHYFPHDVQARELGAPGARSRVDTLRLLGINATVVVNIGLMDGINAVRRIFDRCWFDAEKAGPLVEALTLYRREFDEKRVIFRANPLHDWTSHLADAMRMLAVGIPNSSQVKALPIDKYRRDREKSGAGSFMGV